MVTIINSAVEIIKYFFEEPASLEALAPDLDPDARRRAAPTRPLGAWLDAPRYYRGYVAGTDLGTGRVGLTALAHRHAFIDPLIDALGERRWIRSTRAATVETLDAAAVPHVLAHPRETTALVCANALPPEADVVAATEAQRRYAVPALRRLLAASSCVVFFPEPAHHGHDWSFFAARPLRAALAEAFRQHPQDGVRRFIVPYRKARSEHTFYFETWQLDQPLPDYIEEI